MTILVSNANGKVGQEVAKALLAGGFKVRVGARDVAKAAAEFPGAEVVKLDLDKPESLASATAGVSAVFSATPYHLLPQDEKSLIAAAQVSGVKRFVKLSASGVEADPSSPHALAEAALADSTLEWTVLRPTFFMQNYSTAAAGQVKSGAFYEPAGDGATSFVDTRDIADVAVVALTQPGHHGKAYTLTGPAALTRNEVAAELSRAIGRPVKYIEVDDAALRGAMAGAPTSLIDLKSTLFGYVRQGYTAGVAPDVATVTGRPARDFASFAADHAAIWKS
jgi:uncharacterized protein YbjT (DUF2867 family)